MKKALAAAAILGVVIGIWFIRRDRSSSNVAVERAARELSNQPTPPAPEARPESGPPAASVSPPPPAPRPKAPALPRREPRTKSTVEPTPQSEPIPERPVETPSPVRPRPEQPSELTPESLPAAEKPTVPLPPAQTAREAGAAVRPPSSSELELVAVRAVLQRYEQLYDQLDAAAAPTIWPHVDSRALSRIFEGLKRQDLNFDGCVFALAANRATAQCTGSLLYVPRVGQSKVHTEHHSWTIEFERGGQGWQITKVHAR